MNKINLEETRQKLLEGFVECIYSYLHPPPNGSYAAYSRNKIDAREYYINDPAFNHLIKALVAATMHFIYQLVEKTK